MEERQLFGGAIVARIPKEFVDVSKFREIPDHQEVYGNVDTDQSIIIELLSTPEGLSNETSAAFHFSELADNNDASEPENNTVLQIKEIPSIELQNFQGKNIYVSFLLGSQKVPKYREVHRNVINIYLCLIRIFEVQTDLLITFNEPVAIDEHSSSFSTIDKEKFLNRQNVLPIFESIAKSIKIVDWSLFQ